MIPLAADPRNRPENLVKTEFLQQHIVRGGMSLRVGAGCCRVAGGGLKTNRSVIAAYWRPPGTTVQLRM